MGELLLRYRSGGTHRVLGVFPPDDPAASKGTGERNVEAVVSGSVTETSTVEQTQVEWPCLQCGPQVVVSYREERVASSCPECSGIYGESVSTDDSVPPDQRDGYLGSAPLPPASLEDREGRKILQAAYAWSFLEPSAMAHDICPRCSTTVQRTFTACQMHNIPAAGEIE